MHASDDMFCEQLTLIFCINCCGQLPDNNMTYLSKLIKVINKQLQQNGCCMLFTCKGMMFSNIR